MDLIDLPVIVSTVSQWCNTKITLLKASAIFIFSESLKNYSKRICSFTDKTLSMLATYAFQQTSNIGKSLSALHTHIYFSDFQNESNGIFVLGVGFFLQKNFDFSRI